MITGDIRIGQGYDIHQLRRGRPLVIGGVTIPSEKGALAHSDGDVLLHALAEAVLGALALGDLGTHFPSTAENLGIDSTRIIAYTAQKLKESGFKIINIDSSVYLEKPYISALTPQMVANICAIYGLEPDQVSIKPGTAEKTGPIGRHQAVAAQVSLLIERSK